MDFYQRKEKAVEIATRLVANEEGYRYNAYRNHPKEPWTAGFGFTRWPDGRPVKQGETMNREFATDFLRKNIPERLEAAVRAVPDGVKQKLSANQMAALVSFHFNLGDPQYQRSFTVREVKRGNFRQAADLMLNWKRGNTSNDLLPRRHRERKLFLTPDS